MWTGARIKGSFIFYMPSYKGDLAEGVAGIRCGSTCGRLDYGD